MLAGPQQVKMKAFQICTSSDPLVPVTSRKHASENIKLFAARHQPLSWWYSQL